MQGVVYRRFGLKIKTIWFAKERLSAEEQGCDIVFYRQSVNNFAPDNKLFNSLITDLSLGEDQLFQMLDKNCRYEVRRAQRDAIHTYAYDSDFLKANSKDLNNFIEAYNEFAASKSLGRCNSFAIRSYIEKDMFILTIAKQEECPLVYHAYISTTERVRLWYSASLFRSETDQKARANIGRANRLLHWQDLLYFKERGIREYDWGGYSDAEETRNITIFKRQFGGTPETSYHISIPCSFKGRLALTALGLLGKS